MFFPYPSYIDQERKSDRVFKQSGEDVAGLFMHAEIYRCKNYKKSFDTAGWTRPNKHKSDEEKDVVNPYFNVYNRINMNKTVENHIKMVESSLNQDRSSGFYEVDPITVLRK